MSDRRDGRARPPASSSRARRPAGSPAATDPELVRLLDEVRAAESAVRAAKSADDPAQALAAVTVAIERLTATQHELVNVLLERGVSWDVVGEALNTDSMAAERRFPRRAAPTRNPDPLP
jgi:hypothetical protein